MLESFPGPWHCPRVEKPCSVLPAYSRPWSCGHNTPWWQEVPSAPLKGLRRVPASTASAHTRTTLSFPRQQPQLCWHQHGLRGRVNMSHYCMAGGSSFYLCSLVSSPAKWEKSSRYVHCAPWRDVGVMVRCCRKQIPGRLPEMRWVVPERNECPSVKGCRQGWQGRTALSFEAHASEICRSTGPRKFHLGLSSHPTHDLTPEWLPAKTTYRNAKCF